MKFLRVLGWVFVPYVMIFLRWKNLQKVGKTLGVIYSAWSVFWLILFSTGFHGDKTTVAPAAVQTAKATDAKKIDPLAPQLKPEITTVSTAGGLGDSLSQIEKTLGKPTRVNQEMKDGSGQYNYQNDLEVVTYAEGRVQSIAYQLDTQKKSMKEKDALEFIKKVMPADATLVKKIDVDKMERIYVYHSKSLEGLFSDDWFKDSDGKVQPGEFGVDFSHDGGTVDSFNAAIGGSK